MHVLLRDGARLAVAAVDEVGELFELPAGGAFGAPPSSGPGLPTALQGVIWLQGERVWLLDTAALLRAPSTALAAARAPASEGLSTSSARP